MCMFIYTCDISTHGITAQVVSLQELDHFHVKNSRRLGGSKGPRFTPLNTAPPAVPRDSWKIKVESHQWGI